MPTILLTSSIADSIYLFRRDLLECLTAKKYRVIIVCAYSDWYIKEFEKIGCEFINLNIKRQGKTPISDINVLMQYLLIIRKINPDIVLTYTVKPNIYASLACRFYKIPYINNITGLGIIGNKGILQIILFYMQRVAFRNSSCIFFQNEINLFLYQKKNIVHNKYCLIPGSGVSLDKFYAAEYPIKSETIKFLSILRLRKDKGIEELVEAIQTVGCNNIEFYIIGPSEDDTYIKKIKELQLEYPVFYYGSLSQDEVRNEIIKCHCLIHPSHSEGMANVILESAASARPVIASNIPGCHEAVEDGISGFLFPKCDIEALIFQIKRFIALPWDKKRDMGLAGRQKMEQEFDRQIVTDAYMEEINKCLSKNDYIHSALKGSVNESI